MNIISIDPSLSCTAVVVNGKSFIFANENLAYTEKLTMKKWFKVCEDLCKYKFHKQFATSNDHTTDELVKFNKFSCIVDNIVEAILQNIDPKEPSICGIEGYSYSSMAGPLIDLVTFGTILRTKLLDSGAVDLQSLVIFPPSKLKLEAAMLTYPSVTKGKKVEYRNNNGISGGSFKKPDMFLAIIENSGLTDGWAEFLRENSNDILDSKSIPKPIEDINDAYIMYQVLKKRMLTNK